MIAAEDDLAVSVFATAGTDREPTLCIHAVPIPAIQYADGYDRGLALVTPLIRALPADSLSPHIKTRNRLHWHIADAQAGRVEAGAKALLLDADGFVTETATGNLFVVTPDGRRILTPRRSTTLDGISRAFAVTLLPRAVEEADLRADEVAAASEAFVTSSVYCVQPVTRLNGLRMEAGPVYRRLLRDWSDRVGVDIAAQMRRMAGERKA